MKYVACLPFRVQEFRDQFMATCKLENVIEVDNTKNNIGIMASHNIGIRELYKQDADWFIIMSAAIRFGEPGGIDVIEYLANTDYHIVEGIDLYGWHFVAFRRDVIDAVGEWDENFTPYGYDDLDYSIRVQKAVPNLRWGKVKFDISDTIMGHSIKLGGVVSDDERLRQYFKNKWGIFPGGEHGMEDYYETPFNLKSVTLKYYPKENEKNNIKYILRRSLD